MIFCPPRHGKSELISRYLPAWHLGTQPESNVIITSHTYDLAADFSSTARDVLLRHAGDFAGPIAPNRATWAKDHWRLTAGGSLRAAGIGGPITGAGADLLIIDDPIKDAEQATSPTYRERLWNWWQSTASTRLEPGGHVVLMNTRWHEEDLSGRLLQERPDRWRVLSLPALAGDDGADLLDRLPGEALWPERWPREALEQIRLDKTAYWWGAMYQQRPGLFGENSWPEEYFATIWADQWPERFDAAAIGIDPALGEDKKRGDYSACVFVGRSGGHLYADAWLGRLPPPAFVDRVLDLYVRYHPPAVACEANGFQSLLGGLFRAKADAMGLAAFHVRPVVNTGHKATRIEGLTPLFSRGRLHLRKDSPHNRLLLSQLRSHPNADHDDGPDGLQIAVHELERYLIGQQSPIAPRLRGPRLQVRV